MNKRKEFAYDKIELCRNCDGVGTVEIVRDYKTFERASATETCPMCGGAGRILKRIEGTVEVSPYGARP